MRRYAVSTLLAVALAAPAAPAAAGTAHGHLVGPGGPGGPSTGTTTGRETFHGFLLTSGRSGQREVVASAIVGRGVFDGIGRLVEVPSRPGDPDSVSRDDLVFRAGTMHVVSRSLHVATHLDRRACRITADIPQRSRITGGTGRFADASGRFVSHVHAVARLARTPKGGCDMQAVPLRELDIVNARGTLTY